MYKNIVYNGCAWSCTGGGYYWCSTKVDTDGNYLRGYWGKCSSGCQISPKSKGVYYNYFYFYFDVIYFFAQLIHLRSINENPFKFLDGSWIQGHSCPQGQLSTHFEGNLGYNLKEAKQKCALGCNTRIDCFFADLYYTSSKQTCYLRGSNCGSWQTSTHWAYHLYQKAGNAQNGTDCINYALN